MPTAPLAMPFWIGDFLRDTEEMSATEVGAYVLLIGYCWSACGELPNDEKVLRRITRLDRWQWRRYWPNLRLHFQETLNHKLQHKRVTNELCKALKYRAVQSANAQRRLVPKKKKDNTFSAARDSSSGVEAGKAPSGNKGAAEISNGPGPTIPVSNELATSRIVRKSGLGYDRK